jgi:hypothetical protein
MDDLKRGAARTKAHPPAAKKASEASAAAKGPANERLATGKAKQVDKIQEAPTKTPEPATFLEVLQAEIAKAMPKTLADTETFMKGGSSEQLKGGLKGNVSQQKQAAEGGVKSAEKEPPKETGPGTPGAEIPKEPTPTAPAVNGAEAMPAPKSDADVSLQDSKQDTQDQMKQADVSETQLKKANDPRFSAVVTAKDQVAQQADAGPAQYRGQEKQVVSGTAAVARGVAGKGSAGIAGVRGGSNSAVLSRQAAAKAKDEAKRKEVIDHIEQIYNKTKENVEAKLNSLETDVGAMFDSGTDAALQAMTDFTEKRIDEYKDDRYSGIIGKGRWIRDQFKGLPADANVFYEQGRALFARLMNALVVKVAATVDQRLKEAKDEVKKGQAEIKAYVDGQPKELQAVAKKAQSEVAERFTELEHSIDDKKQQLAESLAQKYKEGFGKANEALKKIQDANKGLVAGFVEKLKAVIEAIIEFKNKLMAVLRKGADAIKLILADPIGFLSNLLSAIKQGFSQFASNIWTHLKAGFMKWMFGSLAEAGIEIPTDLTLPSILKLVLGVLGITYERMRAKAVKLVGERAVKFIEKVADYIKTLITGGFAALWEKVKEDLGSLKEMVIDAIQDWLITTIVKKAVAKIATMFNPVGAIIQAILAIVDVVIFVVEKANQILEFITAVVESVSAIAMGQIASAANWIEKSLANMIPLLIGFLAQLLGLGGISKKIKDFITKIQDKVDKAIDKAIAKVVALVKKLLLGGGDKESPAKPEKDETLVSKDLKANIKNDVDGKQVGSKQDEDALFSKIWTKYQPLGLKGLKFVAASSPGAIDVIVSASLAERIAAMKVGDIPQLVTLAKKIEPYSSGTRIYITYDGGTPYKRWVSQKRDDPGHAETFFMREHAGPLMRTIVTQYRAKKTRTPFGQPVPIVFDINRLPCKGCTDARIVEFLNQAKADYPDVPIRLTINAAALTKQSSPQMTLETILTLRAHGVEVNASTVWEQIENKMKQFAAYDFKGEFYTPLQFGKFRQAAGELQGAIDEAVQKANAVPKQPKTAGSGT